MKTKITKRQAGAPGAGTTSQVLTKNSNTDFDYDWADGGSGGSGGGSNDLIAAQTSGADVTIPGGTLDSENCVEFEIFFECPNGGQTFEVNYGGSVLGAPTINVAIVTTYHGFVKGYLFAKGATNSQHGAVGIVAGDGNSSVGGGGPDSRNVVNTREADIAVDSTIDQILNFNFSGAGGGPTIKSLIVRKVTKVGGTNKFTVNADETQGQYINTALDPNDGSWTYSGGGVVKYGNGIQVDGSNNAVTTNGLVGYNQTGTFAIMTWDAASGAPGKVVRLRLQTASFASGGTAYNAFGFGEASSSINYPDVSVKKMIFAINNASIFAVTSNGAAETSTNCGAAPTSLTPAIYEIIWNPGTDVKFYVNGVLKATHTTNIPTGTAPTKIYLSPVTPAFTSASGVYNGLVLSQLI